MAVPAAPTVAVEGVMDTETGVTVTVDDADRVGSATLVAVTLALPPVDGAVHDTVAPDAVASVPALAVHCTAVFALPVTVAVKLRVAPEATVAVAASTLTPIAATETVADADLVASSLLVAVMV